MKKYLYLPQSGRKTSNNYTYLFCPDLCIETGQMTELKVKFCSRSSADPNAPGAMFKSSPAKRYNDMSLYQMKWSLYTSTQIKNILHAYSVSTQ